MITQGKIVVDDLNMSVSGSGDLEVDVDGSGIDGRISGSGKILAEGTADNIELSISGSGKFSGENLKAKTASARISGSGNAKVYATEEVEASISGSGTVYYKGDPKRKYANSSGSGKSPAP